MSLEDFNFPFHKVGTGENPTTGVNIQLGNSYVFTAPSPNPDQRIFKLRFPAMQLYFDSSDNLVDNVNVENNFYALYQFYQRHKLYKSFNYEHPMHGLMVVKFSKPLPDVQFENGGHGVSEDFTVELIEVP